MSSWIRQSVALGYPANYTEDDPLDLQGKQPIFDSMNTEWWNLPAMEGEKAVVNAFRATMLSPRMNLKSNAILYQSVMNIDPHESDPSTFENSIRELKAKWDAQGQTDLLSDPEETLAQDQILPGKFLPGFWTNLRRLAALGPHADDLYQAALTDVLDYNGTGEYFRNYVLKLGIPGVGTKVASFAWLALAPLSSELGTIDVHMMRHLGEPGDSPNNESHYYELENQLRDERDQYYPGVPLTQYQWGVWDARRTPGYHQDHSPLRPVDPISYKDIHWAPTPRPPRPAQPQQTDPNQLSLSKTWKKSTVKPWEFYKLGGYSIQGETVGSAPKLETGGIAIRRDTQSDEEIQQILNNLPSHSEDAARGREQIPEWAINRGGKVADFRQGPSGEFTYAPGAILVSEWVDVNDNWILYHDGLVGIVAGKGGATSHGVVVARARNIPVVVNVPQWGSIQAGDHLTIDSQTGIIHGNGGSTQQFDEAEEALEPTIAFVWSEGNRQYRPIPPGSGGAAILHKPMIRELKMNGQWNKLDYALGVIYADGNVQMQGQPSDEDQMMQWLNTIQPIKGIEPATEPEPVAA